jgi:hypothetical protein
MCVKHTILKNIQWSLHYNLIYIYFIKLDNEKIDLDTILIDQFQIFIILFFFKFCIENYRKQNGTHNGFIIK